jgi:DNA-binding winged helix-turn-helix (wHTH) protein
MTNKEGYDKKRFEILSGLKAEDEVDWLDSLSLEPFGFDQMVGSRSAIVFGPPGSGKTVLYHQFKSNCLFPNGKHRILTVDWKPRPISTQEEGNITWINGQLKFLLDACSIRLIEVLTNYLDELEKAPEWVKARLAWFLKNNLQGNPQLRLGPVLDSERKNQAINNLFNVKDEGLFYTEPSPEQVINELIVSLGHFGITAIWVLADGVQDWNLPEPRFLEKSLFSFFSMLSIFENTKLSFKFILPQKLESSIAQASGIVRRRIDRHSLVWEEQLLLKMIEKRLGVIFGRDEPVAIQKLCKDPDFYNWLVYFGGDSPREWLDLLQPYIKYYVENDLSKPIDDTTSTEIQNSAPLRFHIDDQDYIVKIGGRVVPIGELPPKVFKMLQFLYKNAGKIISKEQLYFQAYLGLENVPSRGDKMFEEPTSYINLIDTSIYRLRQAIEPDPAKPVILRTERGYGVKLVVRYL